MGIILGCFVDLVNLCLELINNLTSKQSVTQQSNDQVSIQSNNAVSTDDFGRVGLCHDWKVKASSVLQTARVKLPTNGGNSVETIVIFDLGADTIYVSHDLLEELSLNELLPSTLPTEPLVTRNDKVAKNGMYMMCI